MSTENILIATHQGKRWEMEDRAFAFVFPTHDLRSPELDLKDFFEAAHNATESHESGAVLTALFYHAATHSATVAQLGDCRAYVSSENGKGGMQSKRLGVSHTPILKSEKKTLLERGGKLNETETMVLSDDAHAEVGVTRALGDHRFSSLSRVPDIFSEACGALPRPFYLIAMTNGFFIGGRPKITRYDTTFLQMSWDENPVKAMAQTCLVQSKGMDNMACAVTKIDHDFDHDVLMLVVDGHNGAQAADTIIATAREFCLSRYTNGVEVLEHRPQ